MPGHVLPIYVDERWADPAVVSPAAIAGAHGVPQPQELSSAGDLAGVAPGDLVVLSGHCTGNPMVPMLDFLATSIPLVVGPRPALRRTELKDALDEQRVLAGLVAAAHEGMRSSPVVDLVVVTDPGLRAVVVADRTRLGAAGEAVLGDARCRVVGAVASVLGDGDQLSLVRHCLLSAVGPAAARDMLTEVSGDEAQFDLPDPVLDGPAVQIVPIAIYV